MTSGGPPVPEHDAEFEQLLAYLRDSRGSDFTGYKRPSLHRLVDRRMRVAGASGYGAYRDLLEAEPAEANALLDALLINVTAFFRDPPVWQLLREELLPAVLAELGPEEPVRVWSAACATGEEAYSLAVLLHELLGDEAFRRRVKIYATDVDEAALAVARAGSYPTAALADVDEERVATYFEPDGAGRSRFRADLRPQLIFGRHDLLVDAPIGRVLLLTCRNALMYFTPDRQTRVLERFSFALHPHGLLVLGRAEMLLTQSQLFTPLSLPQRVFRARRAATGSRLAALAVGGQARSAATDERSRYTDAAFDAAPAAQLVLDSGTALVLVNERAQRDLPLSDSDVGRPFLDLELARLPVDLRGAVATVQAARQVVELRDVEGVAGGTTTRWDVRLAPLQDDRELLGVHVVFTDVSERTNLLGRLEEVQHELSTAYEELQSSSEELETSNEELQSAVEELETTNEELQSTNEELETMNEELQSTNEELQTLNDELRERTREVDDSNALLQGILAGLETALAVTDADGVVLLWNEAAERLSGLRAFEVEGRPLGVAGLDLPPDDLRRALREVVALEQERAEIEGPVTNRFGRRHVRRLLLHPLRHRSGTVRGAVVTISEAAEQGG